MSDLHLIRLPSWLLTDIALAETIKFIRLREESGLISNGPLMTQLTSLAKQRLKDPQRPQDPALIAELKALGLPIPLRATHPAERKPI